MATCDTVLSRFVWVSWTYFKPRRVLESSPWGLKKDRVISSAGKMMLLRMLLAIFKVTMKSIERTMPTYWSAYEMLSRGNGLISSGKLSSTHASRFNGCSLWHVPFNSFSPPFEVQVDNHLLPKKKTNT